MQLDWCFSFFSNEKSSHKQPPPNNPPNVIQKRPAFCSAFLSISVSVEESVDERQERRKSVRERRSGELHCVDLFWLALHRPRLIIIKTHTTWHVYLMAAPGEDGKLLLSLTVTCWSTTVPCGTPSVYEWEGLCVCVCVGIILYMHSERVCITFWFGYSCLYKHSI